MNENSDNEQKIGCMGDIVEIDEAHIFTNKRWIGCRLVGVSYYVLGGIDRTTKNIF